MRDIEVADKYLRRFGMSLQDGIGVEKIFEVMDRLLLSRDGVFLLKIDGERASRKYTYVYTERSVDAVIRMDTDDTFEGAVHILAELERAGVIPVHPDQE